eukprot:m.148311 g.148311  ORF g.148311 m.148311 type:complete len:199 (-) comp14173_c0_seq8:281-877(-)
MCTRHSPFLCSFKMDAGTGSSIPVHTHRPDTHAKDQLSCRSNLPVFHADIPLSYGGKADIQASVASESPEWTFHGDLGQPCETLAQTATAQGIALQAIHIGKINVHCFVRGLDRGDEMNKTTRCFLRVTFDGWKSFQDIEGALFGDCNTKHILPHTVPFEVTFRLPDGAKAIEFACCLQVTTHTHTDKFQLSAGIELP